MPAGTQWTDSLASPLAGSKQPVFDLQPHVEDLDIYQVDKCPRSTVTLFGVDEIECTPHDLIQLIYSDPIILTSIPWQTIFPLSPDPRERASDRQHQSTQGTLAFN